MRSTKHQKGFTWVELTIVVVIFTILMLIISSRYLDVFDGAGEAATKVVVEAFENGTNLLAVFDGKDAAATKVVAKAFESGTNLIHSKWVDQPEHGDTIEVDELVIAVTPEGWAKQLNENVEGCVAIWNEVLTDAPPITIYNSAIDVEGWSVGGGADLC